MLTENTSFIRNGSEDIFILLEGEKLLGELIRVWDLESCL